MQLRKYQETAISEITAQFNSGIRSVLYQLPTGGGKTVVFSSIIQQAVDRGHRVCVLVHRVELLNQAQKTLQTLGISSGRIKGKERYDGRCLVQVASVQTLSRQKSSYAPDLFDLLVIDEAHHAVAGSWDRVIKRFHTAKVLGVTATPCRLDGRGLGNAFEVLIQGPQLISLQNNGFLAIAKVYAPPPTVDLQSLKSRMGDFQLEDASSQLSAVHVIGDVISHYQKHLGGATAIAFCCSVAHAESVAEAFNKAGIRAASIDGSMSEEQRAYLLQDLSAGSLKILTSCALIGEGVDVPSVGGCILLRPTKSLALHLQMIGRCLRPDGGKPAVILDHVGNYKRLGHHLLERSWSLDNGVALAVTSQTKQMMLSWLCQSCNLVAPTSESLCPQCGALRPTTEKDIVTVEADLVPVSTPESSLIDSCHTKEDRERAMEHFAAHGMGLTTDELIRVSGVTEKSLNRSWGGHHRKTLCGYALHCQGSKPRKGMPDKRKWTLEPFPKIDYDVLHDAKRTCDTFDDLVRAAEGSGHPSPAGWAKIIMYHRRKALIEEITRKLARKEMKKRNLDSHWSLPKDLSDQLQTKAKMIVGEKPIAGTSSYGASPLRILPEVAVSNDLCA